MNKGRMVQLYNKSTPAYSPIIFTYGDKQMSSYVPVFSLINGKFVPVV